MCSKYHGGQKAIGKLRKSPSCLDFIEIRVGLVKMIFNKMKSHGVCIVSLCSWEFPSEDQNKQTEQTNKQKNGSQTVTTLSLCSHKLWSQRGATVVSCAANFPRGRDTLFTTVAKR